MTLISTPFPTAKAPPGSERLSAPPPGHPLGCPVEALCRHHPSAWRELAQRGYEQLGCGLVKEVATLLVCLEPDPFAGRVRAWVFDECQGRFVGRGIQVQGAIQAAVLRAAAHSEDLLAQELLSGGLSRYESPFWELLFAA